jgi:hypothetical protein
MKENERNNKSGSDNNSQTSRKEQESYTAIPLYEVAPKHKYNKRMLENTVNCMVNVSILSYLHKGRKKVRNLPNRPYINFR